MILTCPACGTQYRLKDDAIPPEGRQVRCAACKHKWHEAGEQGAAGAAVEAVSAERAHGGEAGISGGPPQPAIDDAEAPLAAVPEAAVQDQMIAAEPEPEVAPEGHGAFAPASAAAPEASEPLPAAGQWDMQRDVGPRESGLSEDYGRQEDYGFAAIPAMHEDEEPHRGSKLGWIVGLVLLVVAAAAAFWFLAPPELKARMGIAEAGESPLQLMLTTSDRQKLASGNELLAISGRVINATDREQAVPPILAELRDPASNRLVYKWTIAAPARSLAPGAAASFNSAEVDVPKGGESLSLRFAS